MKKLILLLVTFYYFTPSHSQTNTIFGVGAGVNLSTTYENSAFGYKALNFQLNGSGANSAFGSESLRSNTDGTLNSAFGTRSLESNTTGNFNLAFGHRALGNNQIGSNNVAIGVSALSNEFGSSTKNYNVAVGNGSGPALTSGIYNTFIGSNSGSYLETGNYNVFIGRAQVSNLPSTNLIAGNDTNKTIILSDGEGFQRLIITGNGDAGIGLGTAEKPQNKLEINSDLADTSGLRFRNLKNSSASITNPTNKILSVSALGDVILVDDKQGASSLTTNTLASSTNTMTCTVNGVVATAPIVNTVVNSITSGALTTSVNGVSSTAIALPTFIEVDGSITNELQNLSLNGQNLSISSGNTVILPTQSLSISGNQLTISNGNSITLPAGGVTTNIYNTSASITPANFGDRVVSLNNNNLVFNTTGTNAARNKVYIGSTPNYPTTTGNYKLYVEGGILTEKVKVALRSTANWADSVFASDYKLTPLNEVEHFVKTNKHLQGITSAENLVLDGLDLAEMQAKQMAKIEELTLYAIQQNKKLEKQNKEIEDLKVLLNALVNKNK
jgi:trimeric autotransporter adhesin